jgi:serine/threonine-protein kinase RsbW
MSGDIIHTDILLDSTLKSVDQGEELALEAARGVGFSGEDLNDIGIAVRECLVNAVTHGNRYNAKKKVHLRILIGGARLTVEVMDEGAGFAAAEVPDPLEGDNLLRQSGRGILMMRHYMDEVESFPREGGGTGIRMVKSLAG